MKKFYVTTAIDYTNAEPHVGHAYQKIVSDVLARWKKLNGYKVFFLTGTDEHGKKIADSAKRQDLSPKEFVDKVSKEFKSAWELLNIDYDRFIRTTDDDHKKTVDEITKKINENKDIYKGEYEGYYCTGCETFYTETENPELFCQIHKKPLEKLKEEAYFFRLSRYQKFLLMHYDKNPEFILPSQRKKEVSNRIKGGLKDLCITRKRSTLDWGIPFTLDNEYVFYVWYEALINYYTATQGKGLGKFWPADLHLLGVDNMWFHAVIWPAMLKSAKISLPKTVFNHGFLTFEGKKISKSLGNAILIKTLVEKYGADTVRYFMLRQFPFASGEDGDFSEDAMKERHNNELANKLGNLVSRVSALAEKYGLEKTKSLLQISQTKSKVSSHFDNYEFDKALNEIFAFIDKCNEYIQSKKPWETQDKKVLYELANAIKDITILLYPFIPETAEKIAEIFNFKISIDELEKPLKISKVKKADILFRKI